MRPHAHRPGPVQSWILTLAGSLALTACAPARDAAEDGLFQWTISTAVEIDASPAQVWSVLVDLPAYHEWNPFIVEATGTVAVGERLSLRMVLPGRDPITIEPRLLAVEPERELRWKRARSRDAEREMETASAHSPDPPDVQPHARP